MHLVCPGCGTTNRVPEERLRDAPERGRCGAALMAAEPLALDDETFQRFVDGTELPCGRRLLGRLCGPCRTMAPHFAAAARELPEVLCFAKVDTDASPAASARLGIRHPDADPVRRRAGSRAPVGRDAVGRARAVDPVAHARGSGAMTPRAAGSRAGARGSAGPGAGRARARCWRPGCSPARRSRRAPRRAPTSSRRIAPPSRDLDPAVARASLRTGEARRALAGTLWKPNVVATGAAGVAGSDTRTCGASFSAPGFGDQTGVAFRTSVTAGPSLRWSVAARQPLLDRGRDARRRASSSSRPMPRPSSGRRRSRD